MDNKKGNRNAGTSFLTRRIEIPAWELITIAITLILAAVAETIIPILLLIGVVIALIVIGLLPIKKTSTFRQMDGVSGYTITVSNYPENVTPELLEISSDEVEELKYLDKDGVGIITSIAGNLVFYDKNKEFVTNFPEPVRLTFNYTDDDEQGLMSRKKALIKEGTNADGDEVKLIPIYLYTFEDKGKPAIKIWKPFQNFSIDKDNRTMTIEFLFWGDQQIGGGTRP